MNTFRTEIIIPNIKSKINYNSKIMFLGSCFSNNIGSKLSANKFDTLINPFGVIYNPISVSNSLDILIDNKVFLDKDLYFDNNQWQSFSHHSIFSNIEKHLCLEGINKSIEKSSAFLKQADCLFITLGTAWVFKLIENQKIVSNCHKLSPNKFERQRLSIDTIIKVYDTLVHKLKKYNPKIEIIFTISPIRHWKDGAHENQLSKSTLLLAVDHLQKKHSYINYFPSYEIVMDELRDYRFYGDDMLHISNVAIDYIWTKFIESLISSDSISTMKNISKIIQACNHRPFNYTSSQHQLFIQKTLNKIKQLNLNNKEQAFHDELKKLNSQLIVD